MRENAQKAKRSERLFKYIGSLELSILAFKATSYPIDLLFYE